MLGIKPKAAESKNKYASQQLCYAAPSILATLGS